MSEPEVVPEAKPLSPEEQEQYLVAGWYYEPHPSTSAFIGELVNGDTVTPNRLSHACSAVAHAAIQELLDSLRTNRPELLVEALNPNSVMWCFVNQLLENQGPARLVRFDGMLNPVNAEVFKSTIDTRTWEYLQAVAADTLKNTEIVLNDETRAHLESIVDGVVPFNYTVQS